MEFFAHYYIATKKEKRQPSFFFFRIATIPKLIILPVIHSQLANRNYRFDRYHPSMDALDSRMRWGLQKQPKRTKSGGCKWCEAMGVAPRPLPRQNSTCSFRQRGDRTRIVGSAVERIGSNSKRIGSRYSTHHQTTSQDWLFRSTT